MKLFPALTHTFLVSAVLAHTACYSGSNADTALSSSAGPPGNPTPLDRLSLDDQPGAGLPCDVDALLKTRCQSCHGTTPRAPMALVSYADLAAPSRSSPAISTGAMAIQRMNDAANPMPPSGKLAAEEIAILTQWVAGGMRQQTCATSASVGAAADPYATPVICTSNSMYTPGLEDGSPLMGPGLACITCHQREPKAPSFRLAGTVYPTAHEPDRCNGLRGSSGAYVEVADSQNHVYRLPINQAGNFYLDTRSLWTPPYRAKVVNQGRERAMAHAETRGDCNGCHTVNGTDNAPGRIMAP